MIKKYIIEKKDLALLPTSYVSLGTKYSSNFDSALKNSKDILGMNLITHQTGENGQKVKKVFITEAFNIKKEFYAAITLDRSTGMDVFMVSSEGGVIAWITLLAIAGFSPVPFKLLTITSGFIHFNIFYFIIISILTRGSRFFLVAFLIGNFGPAMQKILEKKLLKFSIIASIIIIVFAYFIYKFLNNFIN